MWIECLRIEDLRRLAQVELDLDRRTNLFLGPNGAGKTSVLEAAYLLSYGRSFRGGGPDALIRFGSESFRVTARVRGRSDRTTRLGLERTRRGWLARRDERPVPRLADLFADCAVTCFEPGSHELINGPAETRRAFLDWGVFHVEPEFLATWRRYARALKQRNALLRAEAPADAFAPWDDELGRSGTTLTRMRTDYLAALGADIAAVAGRLLPELGAATLHFEPGWDAGAGPLDQQLAARLVRDRLQRSTRRGPHRADWRVAFELAPAREHLSRGQEKALALACTLAQTRRFHADRGEWPVLALDDLPSELDEVHQQRVLVELGSLDAQLLITATAVPETWQRTLPDARVFHVEQGAVRMSGTPLPPS